MTGLGEAADVDTVIIFTPDIQRLAAFYRDAFDLGEPVAVGRDHIGFRLPSLYLGFDHIAGDNGAGDAVSVAGGVSLWFRVDDLDAAYERLLELGATSRYAPTVKAMVERLASVYDPDGNIVGISERASGS